jgi:hypothetical protein
MTESGKTDESELGHTKKHHTRLCTETPGMNLRAHRAPVHKGCCQCNACRTPPVRALEGGKTRRALADAPLEGGR